MSNLRFAALLLSLHLFAGAEPAPPAPVPPATARPGGPGALAPALGGWPVKPAKGLCVQGTVARIVDGDTIEIEVRHRLRVRLLDCWCPESRTRNLAEKAKGQAATKYLAELAARRDCTLWVPITDEDLGQLLTLGRVLGHVWLVGDEKSISQRMVEAGHAKRQKPPELGKPAKPAAAPGKARVL